MRTFTKLFPTLRPFILGLFTYLFFILNPVSAQTVITSVFADNFDVTDTRTELNPGGIPETTYSIAKDVLTGTSPADPYLSTGRLRVANRKDGSGRLYVTGDLSDYANPFSPKLQETNADSLMWTFNIRNNSSVSYLGFDDNQRALAVILTATESDLSKASGYAMLYYGTSASDTENDPIIRSWRIAKFTDGLYQNTNIENIVERSTSMTTSTTGYYSIKIVYIPSTDMWKLYTRLDTSNSAGPFKDPITDPSAYAFVGQNIDATFTDTTMTHFGFFLNYVGTGDYIQFYDNFELRSFKYDFGTSINTTNLKKNYTTTFLNNVLTVHAEKSTAILYDSKGVLIKQVSVNGISEFNIPDKGLYILCVISPEGVVSKEKLINM